MNLFKFCSLTFCLSLCAVCVRPAFSGTAELTGQMSSSGQVQQQYDLTVPSGIQSITLSIPCPPTENLYGSSEAPGAVEIVSTPPATSITSSTDRYGNSYKIVQYTKPNPGIFTIGIKVDTSTVSVDLTKPMPTNPIPTSDIPANVAMFMTATPEVESGDPSIVSLANTLKQDGDNEAASAIKIQGWLQANIGYKVNTTGTPDDAVSTVTTLKGDVDGSIHLFMAIARAEGIPARYVGGYNFGGSISFPIAKDGSGTMSLSSGSQPDAWVELWFPSAGWLPFSVLESAGFVDSHHLKAWVGADSTSALDLITWESLEDQAPNISFEETNVASPVPVDTVNISCTAVTGTPSTTTIVSRYLPALTASAN